MLSPNDPAILWKENDFKASKALCDDLVFFYLDVSIWCGFLKLLQQKPKKAALTYPQQQNRHDCPIRAIAIKFSRPTNLPLAKCRGIVYNTKSTAARGEAGYRSGFRFQRAGVQIPPGGPENRQVSTCRFFYPLRKQWYIINDSGAIVVSHQSVRTVYHHAKRVSNNFRNDDIQNFVLMICNSFRNWWYARLCRDRKYGERLCTNFLRHIRI